MVIHSPTSETQDGRLRVAIVSSQDGFNGGERQMALLADGLRTRGHEVCFLVRAGGQSADRLIQQGFRLETFSGRGRSPVSLVRIRRILNAFRPDVLHYNDSHSLVSAGVASWGMPIRLRIASRRVDFPIRSTCHYHTMADRIMCVSNAVKHACRNAGMPEDRLRVVHDGVDSEPLLKANAQSVRKELKLQDAQKILVSIASLTDCKGHRYLLDAMPQIINRRSDVMLLCAGEGEMRSSLEAQTKRLGISDHVRFLGFRGDTPNLIAAANMMVVSSHTEGLCSSIIDAMMIGCPVVSTNAGGIPDLMRVHGIPQKETGWMVPIRDANSLCDAVLEALENDHLRELRASVAREYAMRNFTKDCMVDNTIRVYREPNLKGSRRSA